MGQPRELPTDETDTPPSSPEFTVTRVHLKACVRVGVRMQERKCTRQQWLSAWEEEVARAWREEDLRVAAVRLHAPRASREEARSLAQAKTWWVEFVEELKAGG